MKQSQEDKYFFSMQDTLVFPSSNVYYATNAAFYGILQKIPTQNCSFYMYEYYMTS